MLEGNIETIASRVKIRQKSTDYDSNNIKKMYDFFTKALKPIEENVIKIDTSDLSVHEVVKRVAKIIHFEEYNKQDLHSVLDELIK